MYKNIFKNLSLNTEAKYSITKPYESEQIIKIFNEDFVDLKKLVMVDATAGVGGDSINFSKYFQIVLSIEIKLETYKLLKNNINKNNISNIFPVLNNYLYVYNKYIYDILYIDAPWLNYNNEDNIDLFLSNYPLYLFLKDNNINNFKMIYLKVPLNFNNKNYVKYINEEYIIYKENLMPSFKILKIKPKNNLK